ncbi:MAG: zinc-dependent alcohol dehydrogenase family protein [Planctomycetota bacterium]|jgi:propanol-preferring alcohol dehydrogenase
MQACVLHQPAPIATRPLVLEDRPTPEPGPGQVLIRVRACGVCRTDLHVVEGELDQSKQLSPVIPGHQVVGVVEAIGESADAARSERETDSPRIGDRVGVAWLHGTCGTCPGCTRGRENLCDQASFTGWTCDGGYATYALAERDFVYALPAGMDDLAVAPLLCAGIIGYRCLRCCDLDQWRGARLGLYGFGAAGHIAIQIARARGADVYVCTRDQARHQDLATELGAAWVGGTVDQPPVKLDASIIFAPAGEIVPAALKALDRGGRLVLGGIHMSPIPSLEYRDLYWERRIQSVANNTRSDGRAFLQEAAQVGVRTSIETFPLEAANDALIALKQDAIRGAAVLAVDAQLTGGGAAASPGR